jgi:hypothetical protein
VAFRCEGRSSVDGDDPYVLLLPVEACFGSWAERPCSV